MELRSILFTFIWGISSAPRKIPKMHCPTTRAICVRTKNMIEFIECYFREINLVKLKTLSLLLIGMTILIAII